MRIFLFLSFLFFSLPGRAQVEKLFDLFTTNRLEHLAATSTQIYAAAKDALLIYTPSSGTLERLSAQGELSDTSISAVFANNNLVIIGYSTGNMDILQDNKITNIPVIKKSISLLPSEKRINSFFADNGLVWLATNYGVSSFNLSRNSFDQTIFFKDSAGQLIPVRDVVVKDNKIWTLTSKGIYYTDKDAVGDFSTWNHYNIGNGQRFGLIDNELYILTFQNNTCAVFRLQDSSFVQVIYEPGLYQMRIFDNKIYLFGKKILEFTSSGTQIAEYDTYQFGNKIYANDLLVYNNSLYVADRFNSLVKDLKEKIKTASLFSDNVNAVKAAGNLVYILHHTDSTDQSYGYRAVISIVDQKGNVKYFISDSVNQFIAMAVDPKDPKHWFLSSDSLGLVEIKNGYITHIYTAQNSPLVATNNDVRITDLKFDKNGKLWILYNSTKYPVITLSSDYTWQPITESSIAVGQAFSHFILTSQGFFYAPLKSAGLLAMKLSTGDARVFYPSRRIGKRLNDVAEDQDGVLWISTNDGLGYFSTQDFTSSDFKAIRPLVKVILNDTTVYGYLLDNTNCTRTVVDAGNRKWVGTSYFGALLLSSDCQEEIEHFDVNNGSIVTDNIYNLEYNPFTGIVYFLTDQGIIAYTTDSSISMDNYSKVRVFPNPVRPYYNGPITITGLKHNSLIKITDLQGNTIFETRSNGGTAVWNGLSRDINSPCSGVYLIFCIDENGHDKCVKKLLIIR